MSRTKKFGPFVLERMIGRGGMGAVYRARREDTNQIVAVKALLLPLEQERERFTAEIATLKLLRHDNIVKLYGFGQEDGVLYYAMEYVNGPSLATLLKRGRRFTWEEVVYIGVSICRALKHAHDRGIVHRDIKPANIMLLDDGVVKVSDYGIAQYFGNSRLTSANQVVGTIEFMAPEQAQAGALTPRSDVYSLGALMYSLLTGKPPYVAHNLSELLQCFRQGAPESTRSFRPEIPKVVDDVVFDLLQIHPDKRPGDARLIGRRLEGLLMTSSAYPDGNPFKNQKFSLESRAPSSPQHSGSHVDLENPSRSSEEGDLEPAPDFPYHSIADDEAEPESPFERTTELATGLDVCRGSRHVLSPDEKNDDFVLNDETTSSDVSNDSETTTHTQDVPEGTSVEKNVKGEEDAFSLQIDGNNAAPTTTHTDVRSEEPFDKQERTPANDSSFELSDLSSRSLQTTSVSTDKADATVVASDADKTRLASLDFSVATISETAERKDARRHSETTVLEDLAVHDNRYDSDISIDYSTCLASKEEMDVVVKNSAQSTDRLEATPVEKFKKSQFTPVDEAELGDLPQTVDKDESLFVRFRLIFVLALTLLTVLIVRAVMTTSADSLFKSIDSDLRSCSQNDFYTQLRRCSRKMERFVETYPNDSRVPMINYFINELEIFELEGRMERLVQSSGRSRNCLAIQRAYLDARRVSLEDWEEGVEKLRAFIVLYETDASRNESSDEYYEEESLEEEEGNETETDDDRRERVRSKKAKGKVGVNKWTTWNGQQRPNLTIQDQLIVVAKRRLSRLQHEIDETRKADLALLKDRLDEIMSLGEYDPEHAKNLLASANELYTDARWAQDALSYVREYLERVAAEAQKEHDEQFCSGTSEQDRPGVSTDVVEPDESTSDPN